MPKKKKKITEKDVTTLPEWLNPEERTVFWSKVGSYPYWPSRVKNLYHQKIKQNSKK